MVELKEEIKEEIKLTEEEQRKKDNDEWNLKNNFFIQTQILFSEVTKICIYLSDTLLQQIDKTDLDVEEVEKKVKEVDLKLRELFLKFYEYRENSRYGNTVIDMCEGLMVYQRGVDLLLLYILPAWRDGKSGGMYLALGFSCFDLGKMLFSKSVILFNEVLIKDLGNEKL